MAEVTEGGGAIARCGLVGGLLLGGGLVLVGVADTSNWQLWAVGGTAALMALWWMTEAVPLAATALLPLVLFPALQVVPAKEIAPRYGDRMVFLFLGGFLVALAIERSGLHRRIALRIVAVMGDNPRWIVGGFMLATAALSMWLSNTATTLMLLPIAVSVLGRAAEAARDAGEDRVGGQAGGGFGIALMLGIAYAASIGGVATIIGTPPNIFFRGFFNDNFPDLPQISFGGWMLLAVPFSATLLVLTWLLLTRVLFRVPNRPILGGRDVIAQRLAELGPMQPAEWRMLGVFLATAGLWVFREPVEGFGWAPLLRLGKNDGGWVDDSTVAIVMALVCFVMPAGNRDGQRLLDWQTARRGVPWGILLLFGGGLALAKGMEDSGLAEFLGQRLAAQLQVMPQIGRIAAMAGGMTMLTELTSNLASVNMILPVLAKSAGELQIDPRALMIPATLAASCAFMLPVATPPNAIVYGSGYLKIRDMVKAGVWINVVSAALIVATVTLLG